MSNEVWLVYRSEPYEAPDLLGVYASEEKAEEAAFGEVQISGGPPADTHAYGLDFEAGVVTRHGYTVMVERHPVTGAP